MQLGLYDVELVTTNKMDQTMYKEYPEMDVHQEFKIMLIFSLHKGNYVMYIFYGTT